MVFMGLKAYVKIQIDILSQRVINSWKLQYLGKKINLYNGAEVLLLKILYQETIQFTGIRGYRYYIEDFDACIKTQISKL